MKRIKLSEAFEVVGVLGLIVSLAFVGWEIRQNTKVARAEAYRSFMTELNDFYEVLIDSTAAAFIVETANMRADELNRADWFRSFGTFMILMRTYEGLHKQVSEGVLDESALLLLSQSNYEVILWRDLWPEVSRNLTPDFREYFEQTHRYGTREVGSADQDGR